MSSRHLLLFAVVVAAAVVGCGPATVLDVHDLARGADAPPADADLVPAGDQQVAAWVREEIDRSGRPVIVKFFASWCGPCEAEVPVLLDAAADHPEVAVLGVAHQDPRDDARAWVEEHGVDVLPTVLDLEGETARAFAARGMPSVSFLDDQGRLLRTHTGPIDRTLLEEWIAHLTGDGPRPGPRPDQPATDTPS